MTRAALRHDKSPATRLDALVLAVKSPPDNSAQRLDRYLRCCAHFQTLPQWNAASAERWTSLDEHFSAHDFANVDDDAKEWIRTLATALAESKSTKTPTTRPRAPDALTRLSNIEKSAWRLRPYELIRDLHLSVLESRFLRALRPLADSFPWHSTVLALHLAADERKEHSKSGASTAKPFQPRDITTAQERLLAQRASGPGERRRLEKTAPRSAIAGRKGRASENAEESSKSEQDQSEGEEKEDDQAQLTRDVRSTKKRRRSEHGVTHQNDIASGDEDLSSSSNDLQSDGAMREMDDRAEESALEQEWRGDENVEGAHNTRIHRAISKSSPYSQEARSVDLPRARPRRGDDPIIVHNTSTTKHGSGHKRKARERRQPSPGFSFRWGRLSTIPEQGLESSVLECEDQTPNEAEVQSREISPATQRSTPTPQHSQISKPPQEQTPLRSARSTRQNSTNCPTADQNTIAQDLSFEHTSLHHAEANQQIGNGSHDGMAESDSPEINELLFESARQYNANLAAERANASPPSLQSPSAHDCNPHTISRRVPARAEDVSSLLQIPPAEGQSTPATDRTGALSTLQPGCWLSATAITACITAFIPDARKHRVLESGHLDMTGRVDNFQKGQREQRHSEEHLYIPVHVEGCHWNVALLDRSTRKLEIYDPAPNLFSASTVATHEKAIRQFAQPLGVTEIIPPAQLYQSNTYDCGIYAAVRTIFEMHARECPPTIIPEVWRRGFARCIGSWSGRPFRPEDKPDANTSADFFSGHDPHWVMERIARFRNLDLKRREPSCIATKIDVEAYRQLARDLRLLSQESSLLASLYKRSVKVEDLPALIQEEQQLIEWYRQTKAACPQRLDGQSSAVTLKLQGLDKDIEAGQAKIDKLQQILLCQTELDGDTRKYEQEAARWDELALGAADVVHKRAVQELRRVKQDIEEIERIKEDMRMETTGNMLMS